VLDEKLLEAAARAALERLPDLYREAFVLRDLEELETSEVASWASRRPRCANVCIVRA
jgi:DNA-directed RNA polymerase specialized sigma24 family protein